MIKHLKGLHMVDRQRFHTRLDTVLRSKHVRARLTGQRNKPSRFGRYFCRISPDMIEARLLGVEPRFFQGTKGYRKGAR